MRSVVNDFGAKLVIKTIVVHRKDESAEASKLYFVARRHGKGEAALNAMFARKFEGNEDLEDPRVIANVASQLGILDEYVRGKDREETRSAMEADKARAIRYGVTGTPAWIVEGQLNVDLDVNNLRTVLTALLQKSV
jgi:2-hydroxychromene-2-carboxylate isomerase